MQSILRRGLTAPTPGHVAQSRVAGYVRLLSLFQKLSLRAEGADVFALEARACISSASLPLVAPLVFLPNVTSLVPEDRTISP
mmetsp:Transcript_68994/g.128870  ORF Transcript_68994/g.128870 Transcript_68994/m.128870 type:complete len:83 (+) Transcript_68994:125-373(+)